MSVPCCLYLLLAAPPTPCWQVAELAFTGDTDYANPFAELRLQATFRLGEHTIVRPGFWDGDRAWKVRFAAPSPGTWQWSTVCSDAANAGLHGRQGTIEIVPYEGDNPNYRHGHVRVSDNRRYFVRSDGTPFFWLADTHWQMADWERLHENNAPDARPGVGQFDQLLDDRVAKGFTVYQNYFVGHEPHWWRDTQYTCVDPTRFREVLDPMIARIVDRGLVVAQGIGLYVTALKVPHDSLARLAEYVAARYGAYPLVWFTGQEVNLPPRNGQPVTDLEGWRGAAEAYAKSNGYGQPVGGHMFPGRPTVWGEEPWHSWFPLQGGHTGVGPRTVADYRFYWDYEPRKPFVETEAMYEQIICGPRFADADDVRHVAWKSLLNGSYGFTYGAAAVWLFKWDEADGRGTTYNPGTWWYAGMNLPGSTQVGHLRRFFEGLDWWRLTPRFADPAWCEFVDPERTVAAGIGQELTVLYAYGPGLRLGRLRGLAPAVGYAAWWFDPRTATSYRIADGILADGGVWELPLKPDPGDWVLVLRQGPAPELAHAAAELPAYTGNLALMAVATATATDERNGYRVEQAIDGDANHTWNGWSAWQGDALTLTFEQPLVARQLVLHTKAEYELRGWRVELQTAGGWQQVAEVSGNTAVSRTHELPATPFTALRVTCLRGPDRQPDVVRINELELFAEPRPAG